MYGAAAQRTLWSLSHTLATLTADVSHAVSTILYFQIWKKMQHYVPTQASQEPLHTRSRMVLLALCQRLSDDG